MSARHVILLTALLALGACSARLSSSLPGSAPVVSYVGAQPGSFTAETVKPGIDQLQRELEPVVRRAGPVPVQFSREGNVLKLRCGADESFDPASAQLQPAALAFYAQLAAVLRQRPGSVAHILVRGEGGSGEPSTELSARRADSLQAYLASRGVPGTRLRAEGRGVAQPAAAGGADGSLRIELWLMPIIAGHEAEAWAPPS
jgi:outer membrane protein OmpA-like peptidoglycan-associated protein